MGGIFNPESKFGQMMSFVADLFVLNILFLICCLPIVTIGAAQAGLYNAVQPLRDQEDGRSCYKLFFKGFANGFWRITLVWCAFLAIILIALYTTLMAFDYQHTGRLIHWGIPLAMLILTMLIQSLTTIFHSKFSCTSFQLFRNSVILMITNPFHSIGVAVLNWLPIAMFMLWTQTFFDTLPIFIGVYYTVAYLFSSTIMKKPFQRLIDHLNGDDIEIKDDLKEEETSESEPECIEPGR